MMKHELIALTRRYGERLQKHLRQPSRANLEAAQALGRRAVAIGLETLDMARIHEHSLRASAGGTTREGRSKRAGAFFTEAINPIEKNHLAAREARVQLGKLNETLQRRTGELAASNRQLKQRIVKRKKAEKDLKKSGDHQIRLLKESLQLQQRLRRLTHRLLMAQENERKNISRGLSDEIAQTLLGINVKLLFLKNEATVNTEGLQKEIASTQRLVASSSKTVHRVARGFEQSS
jgi:signal transduction histidine kinase